MWSRMFLVAWCDAWLPAWGHSWSCCLNSCEQSFLWRVNVFAQVGGLTYAVLSWAHACSVCWRVRLKLIRAGMHPILSSSSWCCLPNICMCRCYAPRCPLGLHWGTLRSLFWTLSTGCAAWLRGRPHMMLLISKYVIATYMSFLLVFLPSRLQHWYTQQHWPQVRCLAMLLCNIAHNVLVCRVPVVTAS